MSLVREINKSPIYSDRELMFALYGEFPQGLRPDILELYGKVPDVYEGIVCFLTGLISNETGPLEIGTYSELRIKRGQTDTIFLSLSFKRTVGYGCITTTQGLGKFTGAKSWLRTLEDCGCKHPFRASNPYFVGEEVPTENNLYIPHNFAFVDRCLNSGQFLEDNEIQPVFEGF